MMEERLSDIGEFGLIGKIRRPGDGTGDDCAVMPQSEGLDALVSTDILVEGTHFLLDRIPPFDLGWKSAAVNISDIAAMGGVPRSTFLSLSLPGSTPTSWVLDFMNGFRTLSDKYGTVLRGGDTTGSLHQVCINVTVIGDCPSGSAKLRSTARPGDLICVTGTLGDSAAGLRAVIDGDSSEIARRLTERHYRPIPRVEEGVTLRTSAGVHAMMDISDGIASDILHIMEESGVAAEIDLNRIPVSADLLSFAGAKGLSAIDLACCGGEDYELLFTVSEDSEALLDIPHTVIGRILPPSGNGNVKWNGGPAPTGSFRHF